MESISEKLDRLAALRAAPDAIRLQKQAIIDTILTDAIKAQLAEIDAEFAEPLKVAQDNAALLEDEIKALVVSIGLTVKGASLMAVYSKGREGGWDSAKLKGFAMAHPEILAAKKPDGEPTVSFRNI